MEIDFRVHYLVNGKMPAVVEPWAAFRFQDSVERQKELWGTVGDELTRSHALANPGTRPWAWWELDAPRDLELMAGTTWAGQFPITRARLGGVGKPQHEVLNVVPSFSWGVPDDWVEPDECEFYGMQDAAIDPTDPPIFESQASYLKRHKLLMPGELKRLTAADFKPEKITEII